MPFVKRDAAGNVIAIASGMQFKTAIPGLELEPLEGWDLVELAENHPDVARFFAAQTQGGSDVVIAEQSRNRNLEELERRMSLGAPQEEINIAILNLLKE